MKEHRTLHIVGLVQGVGFRAAAIREAQSLGIGGFVRNNLDGSVSIEAEGEKETLDAFVLWCKKGPLAAEVTGVTVKVGKPKGYTGFSWR